MISLPSGGDKVEEEIELLELLEQERKIDSEILEDLEKFRIGKELGMDLDFSDL